MCWAPGAAALPFANRPTISPTFIAASWSMCWRQIPGAAFRAACGYPIEKKLKSLKAPLTVFAPHDDIIEQTQRVKPLLKPSAAFVDLPELDPGSL